MKNLFEVLGLKSNPKDELKKITAEGRSKWDKSNMRAEFLNIDDIHVLMEKQAKIGNDALYILGHLSESIERHLKNSGFNVNRVFDDPSAGEYVVIDWK